MGDVRVTRNIWGELWSKLCLNAMSNATCGLTGMTPRELWMTPSAVTLEIGLAAEGIRVAEAREVHVEPVLGRISPSSIKACVRRRCRSHVISLRSDSTGGL